MKVYLQIVFINRCKSFRYGNWVNFSAQTWWPLADFQSHMWPSSSALTIARIESGSVIIRIWRHWVLVNFFIGFKLLWFVESMTGLDIGRLSLRLPDRIREINKDSKPHEDSFVNPGHLLIVAPGKPRENCQNPGETPGRFLVVAPGCQISRHGANSLRDDRTKPLYRPRGQSGCKPGCHHTRGRFSIVRTV